MWSVWVNVPCDLEKNVGPLWLGEAVYTCPFYTVDWRCCWVQPSPLWFSVRWIWPFLIRLLKPPAVAVASFASHSSISFCLMYFDALLWGTYTLRVISSWSTNPFIFMWHPLYPWRLPLFWLLFVWHVYLHPFTFQSISSYLKWVSCRQHTVGWYFLIHSNSLFVLISAFRSLMFKTMLI